MFDNYAAYEGLLARCQLVLFMLGMGATLELSDFGRILRRPAALIYALAYHYIVPPILALVIGHVLALEPGIAMGLLVVSLLPGGVVSKVFSYLGRGNVAFNITMTFFTSCAALVTVPTFLRLLAVDYVPADFHVPLGDVVPDISIYMLLPLMTGMVWSHQSPANRMKVARISCCLGWFFVILMVIGSVGSGRIHPATYGWKAPMAIILFCVLAQQISMLPCYAFRWPRPDRLAIGMELTMRNMNLALLLNVLLFPSEHGLTEIADGSLFVILFYAAVAMGAGLPLALNHLRLARLEAATVHVDAAPSANIPQAGEQAVEPRK